VVAVPPHEVLMRDARLDLLTRVTSPDEAHLFGGYPVKLGGGVVETPAAFISGIQKPFGGPNALTSSILGGSVIG
jgi:hypothetical protein